MGYWQYAPPEVDARLADLAELFAFSRAIFFDVAQDEHHWTPSPGSLAAKDLLNSEVGPAGRWGETPVRRMSNVVGTYMMTAAHQLGGLAILHAGHEVLVSPALLTRAVMENCARVFWVLGVDKHPKVDTPEVTRIRVVRAYLEEFRSAEEAKTVAGRLGDKTSEGYLTNAEVYRDLRDKILPDLFEGVTREGLGKRTIEDQVLIGPEEGVTSMYAFISGRGAGITEREALGEYGFLCNMIHPTLYPLREMTSWHETEHGHLESHLSVDLEFLGKLAGASVVTYFQAMSLLMSYMGWSSDKHGEWERLIDRTLPGTFV